MEIKAEELVKIIQNPGWKVSRAVGRLPILGNVCMRAQVAPRRCSLGSCIVSVKFII